MGGVGHRELRMSSSNCCNLYWEQTTSGVSEQDAGTESDSSTGDVYPLSERRRRTASGGGGAGGKGSSSIRPCWLCASQDRQHASVNQRGFRRRHNTLQMILTMFLFKNSFRRILSLVLFFPSGTCDKRKKSDGSELHATAKYK